MCWWIGAIALAAPVEIVRMDGPIRGIAVHGDDLAAVSDDAGILVDRVGGGRLTVTAGADGVLISPDGRTGLFYGERLGAVFVDMATGRKVQTIQIMGGISHAAWSADRTAVILATRWGVMVVDGVSLAIAQKRDLKARPSAVRFDGKTRVVASLAEVEARFDLLDPRIERVATAPVAAEPAAACVAVEEGPTRLVGCEDGVILSLSPEDSWP